VAADALSRKTHHSMSGMRVFVPDITWDLETLGVELVLSSVMESYLSSLTIQPTLLNEIKSAQVGDPEMERIKVNISKGKASGFYEDDQGVIRFQGRVCTSKPTHEVCQVISFRIETLDSKHVFWKALQKAFGTKLRFSSAYHPETDGQTRKGKLNC